MITATTDIRKISGDLRKLREALGITAEQQARDLAGSCAYVAARMSRPQDREGEGGGAKMTA